MKKLLIGCALLSLSTVAIADNWTYEISKSDFDNDKKVASLYDDTGKYEFFIMLKDPATNPENPMTIAIIPPKYKVTDLCDSICTAKINADGNKDLEPIKLLDLQRLNTYAVYGSSKDKIIDIFQNNNVVKIQLPLYRGLDIVTFTQKEKLNMQKLNNVK